MAPAPTPRAAGRCGQRSPRRRYAGWHRSSRRGLLRRRRLQPAARTRGAGARAGAGRRGHRGVAQPRRPTSGAAPTTSPPTSAPPSSRWRRMRATTPPTGPTVPTGASTARTSSSPGSPTRSPPCTASPPSPTARTPTTRAGPTARARGPRPTHGVLRPLADAGLTKADVRALARALGLPNADKPAAPCLASRIPHFTVVDPEKLAQVEALEAAVRALGFRRLPRAAPRRGGPGRAARRRTSSGRWRRPCGRACGSARAAAGFPSSPSTSPASSPGPSRCRWCRSPVAEEGRPGSARPLAPRLDRASTGRSRRRRARPGAGPRRARLPRGDLLRGQDCRRRCGPSPSDSASRRPTARRAGRCCSREPASSTPGRCATSCRMPLHDEMARLLAWPPEPPAPTGGLVARPLRRHLRPAGGARGAAHGALPRPADRARRRRRRGRAAPGARPAASSSNRPGPSSSWPAWTAPCRASWPVSPARPWSPCRPRSATAPRSAASPRCWRCSTRAHRASASSTSTTATAPGHLAAQIAGTLSRRGDTGAQQSDGVREPAATPPARGARAPPLRPQQRPRLRRAPRGLGGQVRQPLPRRRGTLLRR